MKNKTAVKAQPRRWFAFSKANVPEKKSAPLAGFAALQTVGQAQTTPAVYPAMAAQGYAKNPVVYRCVRMICEAAASVPWIGYEGADECETHPGLDIIERPNTSQSRQEFLEAIICNMLLSGNAFIEHAEPVPGKRRLFVLRADHVSVESDDDNWPTGISMRRGSKKRSLSFGDAASVGHALHLKFYDPLDDLYGQSPLEAALAALDVHNAAGLWNKSLLDNAARPSGALIYAPPDNSTLTPEQYETLKQELDEGFSGARNAGRPLLLEGGLHWKAMGLTPSDMDFVATKDNASREIALAFGVPPMLLGIPGDNTYANYQEAQRAFYRLTVLPLLRRIVSAFTRWLMPINGSAFRFDIDIDQIEGLSLERESLWKRVDTASFLTRAEKRQAVGYSPTPQDEEDDRHA
ncbi:MAG: phage portal protein [Pseudomonadota bacterium]